jgi:hypothetical protein
MFRTGRFLRATFAALVVPVSAASAFGQCAMCRAALLNSRDGAALIEGLRQGIVLLLAIPLLITAAVLIRLRRAARVRAEDATAQTVPDGEALWSGHAAGD